MKGGDERTMKVQKTIEEFKEMTERQIRENLPILLKDKDGKAIALVSKPYAQW